MFPRLIIIVIFLLISGCSTLSSTQEPKAKTKIFLDDNNVLHYEGRLTAEANQKLFQLFRKAKSKPTQLTINTPGGDVFLGLELGHWVYDNQLYVRVDRICASSCANYVFPAAKAKLLQKDSALIWHGGSLQPTVSESIARGDSSSIKWRMAEWRFYNKINVNPIINVYGSQRKITPMMDQGFLVSIGLMSPSYIGFDYSINDMKKFGIINIKLLDEEWDWRKYHEKKGTLKTKVLRVNVIQEDLSSPFSMPQEG